MSLLLGDIWGGRPHLHNSRLSAQCTWGRVGLPEWMLRSSWLLSRSDRETKCHHSGFYELMLRLLTAMDCVGLGSPDSRRGLNPKSYLHSEWISVNSWGWVGPHLVLTAGKWLQWSFGHCGAWTWKVDLNKDWIFLAFLSLFPSFFLSFFLHSECTHLKDSKGEIFSSPIYSPNAYSSWG